MITLTVGKETVATDFAGDLCGRGGKSPSYTLMPLKSTTASSSATAAVARAAANPLTYACDDGRTLQAADPDTNTAALTMVLATQDSTGNGEQGDAPGASCATQTGRQHCVAQWRALQVAVRDLMEIVSGAFPRFSQCHLFRISRHLLHLFPCAAALPWLRTAPRYGV
ncbi:MAG: hypothetical protein ABI178_16355 [Rhodanobacter sp.]